MEVGKISEKKMASAQQSQPENVTASSPENAQTISVFTVEDKSLAGRSIQNEADKRLTAIANHVIEKDNKNISTTKRIGIFGIGAALFGAFAKNLLFKGPKPSTALVLGILSLAAITIVGLVELFGGNEKRKAGYTKYASSVKDKNNIDLSVAPELKSDFIEKAGKLIASSENPTPLSKEEIAKYAPAVLGKDNVRTRGIYFVDTKNDNQKAENLLIADSRIDSEKYDGLSEDGIEKYMYEIPAEYSDFVKKYLSNKKLTPEQADKFIQIIKALQTDGVFSKEQGKEKHDGRDEDLDIFDLSGDGNLNYGDICASRLQTVINSSAFSEEKLENLSKKELWDANSLSKLLEITQDNCFDLFDLNGDNNINEEDFALYKNLANNKSKFDINNDGKIDIEDSTLVTNYFKAIMKRYKSKGEFLENTIKIMGGSKREKVLKEYFEDKEREKFLKAS